MNCSIWIGFRNRWFATLIAVSTSIAMAAPAAEPSGEIDSDSPPPTAAKVRIWTAILTDGQTGKPLENIPVEGRCWKTGHREPQPMTFTSGSGGEVKFPLAAGTATLVRIKEKKLWTNSDVAFGWNYPVEPDTSPAPQKIAVWKGTDVRGQLLKPDGTPAANVLVYFSSCLCGSGWKDPKTRRRYTYHAWDWQTAATTEEDGSFSVTVPPYHARKRFTISTAGLAPLDDASSLTADGINKALIEFPPFLYRIPKDLVEQDGQLDLGQLRLDKGVTVTGKVVDADGKPLPRTSLHTVSELHPHAIRAAESADDGSFEFAPLMPGHFTLVVSPPYRSEEAPDANLAHAVFLNQDFDIPETGEPVILTVQAQPHVHLEFEWIDRRTKQEGLVNEGQFTLAGRVPSPGGSRILWEGHTVPSLRGNKRVLHLIVPAALADATLRLPVSNAVSLSYASEGYEHGAGDVPLSGVMNHRRRIIYVDDPN